MDISIRAMRNEDQNKFLNMDASFIVDSSLVLSVTGKKISYNIEEIPSYKKCYVDELSEGTSNPDYSAYIDNPNQIIFLAYTENQVVGKIIVKRHWNKYAFIEDLHVDKTYRRHGVGKKLIEQVKHWAKIGGMPGLMLETQNTNVRAYKFYENCGFIVGGFDFCLYNAVQQEDEAAIYLYLLF